MKRLVFCLLPLLLSCAGTPVSQEAQRLVPLIKAEKYDEAAAIDPDRLAHAFVEALREMKAEGADPNRIVRIADFFFDNYPFCAKDLPIDGATLLAVSDLDAEAQMKLTASQASCAGVNLAKTPGELTAVVESWEGVHADGERCARVVVEWLRKMARIGPVWNRELLLYSIPGIFPTQADSGISDLIRACDGPFAHSRYLPVIALLGADLLERCGGGRTESWNAMMESVNLASRWPRVFHSRRAVLGALHLPLYFEGMKEAGEAWVNSKIDPRMRELGAALMQFASDVDPFSKDRQSKCVREAVTRLIEAGRGTPFVDAARYQQIRFELAKNLDSFDFNATKALVRASLPLFERPLLGCIALTELAYSADRVESTEGLKLTEEALALHPTGQGAAFALSQRAVFLKEADRWDDMVACYEQILKLTPTPGDDIVMDENLDASQSSAARSLAQHFQKRKEWSKALASWERFETYSNCGTCLDSQAAEREIGMGECLERLGRPGDAMPHYWSAMEIRDEKAEAAARRLLEIYRARNALPQLRQRVGGLVAALDKEGERIDLLPGLRWLRDHAEEPPK